jgi:hypothetical protein
MTQNSDLAHIQNWIFDLDNTLYRADAEFFSQIDKKMTAYISRYLALLPDKARIVQKEFLAEYGTSLSGMMAVHGMDPAEFLDYVHDVDLHMLEPDPQLREYIKALPGRKFIFTNGICLIYLMGISESKMWTMCQSQNAVPISNFATFSTLILRQLSFLKITSAISKSPNIWACAPCLSPLKKTGEKSLKLRVLQAQPPKPIGSIISQMT